MLSSKRCLSLIPSSSYLFFSLLSNVVAFKKWKIFHYWKVEHVLVNDYWNAKHVLVNEVQHTYFNINSVSFSYMSWKKKHNLKKTVFFKLCIFFTELLMYLFHWIGDNCVLSKFSLPIIVFSFIQISYSRFFSFWRNFEKHIS